MPCGHCREIKPFSLLVSLFISLKRLLPHLNKRTHIQRSLEFFVVVFFLHLFALNMLRKDAELVDLRRAATDDASE